MNQPFLALALICAGLVQGLSGFGLGLVSMRKGIYSLIGLSGDYLFFH